MRIKKLFFVVAIAVLLLSGGQIAGFLFNAAPVRAQTEAKPAPQKKTDEKKSDVAPEIRAKAVKMLGALTGEIQNFAAPENRVKGQILAADLLWQDDEETARKLFQNALVDLQAMFANLATEAEETPDGSYSERYSLGQLRQRYLIALGQRDPKAALAALQSLREVPSSKMEYDPLKDEELELQLAAAVAKADPGQGYNLAVKSLADGVNYNTLTTLKDLYKNSPEYGAKFAREILAKFKSGRVRSNPNSNIAVTNTKAGMLESLTQPNSNVRASSSAEFAVDLSQLAQFIRTAEELNKAAGRSKDKKPPALTDGEMRETADFIGQFFSRQTAPEPWTIGSAMSIINKYSPTAAQMIRRKLNAEQTKVLETFADASSYEDTTDKTFEELVAEADAVADKSVRDSRYAEAIRKALEKNELEKAEEIAAKIKDKESYGYVLEEIKTQTPVIKARRGDTAEVRRMLVSIKSEAEKVTALTELVIATANAGNREAAAKIADEANQYLPPQVRRQPNLETTVKIANALALVQPERAFSLLETGIAQMNELIAAGVMIDEFYEYRTITNGEVLYGTMEQQGLTHTPNAVNLIKNLATADFERAMSLTDRFARAEIRTFARLKLAEALLNPDAADNEKQLRQQYESEHEH